MSRVWQWLGLFLLLTCSRVQAQPGGSAFDRTCPIFNEGAMIAGACGLNFIGGGVDCVVTPPSQVVDCTISGGGAVGYQTIQEDGTPLTQRATVNFGTGVTCVDNPGATRTDCTASGAAPAFSAITSGTNSTATMTVDTGASIVPSGTGVVRATDVVCLSCISDAELASIFLKSADIDTSAELDTIVTDNTGSGALVFGTSPTLTTPTVSCTGCISDANLIDIVTLDLPSSTLTGIVDDQVLVGNGAGTAAYKTVTDSDDVGKVLTYDQALNAFGARTLGLDDIPDTVKTGTSGDFFVMGNTENPTDGCATWASGLLASTGTACGSGGGGDEVSVDAAPTTNPNFSDTGDINFTYVAPNITGDVKANSVELSTDTVGEYVAGVVAPGLHGSFVEGTFAELGYEATVGGNPALNIGEAVFTSACPGGGFLTEGNALGNNEMLMCFPSLDEDDTTHILVTESASQVLTNKTLAAGSNVIDADTAVALAANGGNCSAGNYPLGVDASGAVETCTADDDVPEAGDFANLSATAPITQSGGTISTSMATDRLLGRDTAGTGVAEELTVGGGLEFTGTGGIQRSALTGDVSALAGSNTTTVADDSHNHDIDTTVTGQSAWGTAATKDTNNLTFSGVEADFDAGAANAWPRLLNEATPTASDCDAAGEAGRLVYDTTTDGGTVKVCLGATGWKDIDDDGGAGGGTMSTWVGTGDSGTFTVDNAETVKVVGGNRLTSVAASGTPNTYTIDVDGAYAITNDVTCNASSDQGSNAETAMANANTAGKALLLPSGCKVRLGSPGNGNAGIDVPAGTKIYCEDSTAGFEALAQRCSGGTYPGAECTSSGQCTGGGTCVDQFGGSNRFAPTTGNTYYMLRDVGAGSGIEVHNCGFWTYQAGPYQRVVDGGLAGNPCRLECDAGTWAGFACSGDALCTGAGGTACTHLADATGGTCTGAPGSASSTGTAKINPLDLARTANVILDGVRILDQMTGDFGISTGNFSTITNTNVAVEVGGCTAPPGYTAPATGTCTGGLAGQCCYGAMGFFVANTQPTTGVTNGILTGLAPVVRMAQSRGSTQAFNLGAAGNFGSSTLEDSDVWPQAATGPGTASAGMTVAGASSIVHNTVLFPKASTTAIATTGASAITNNVVKALNGSSALGIHATSTASVVGNTIADVAGTAPIGILAAGDDIIIDSNSINYAAAMGIDVTGTRTIINDNGLTGTTGTGIRISASAASRSGYRIVGNISQLAPGTFTTPSSAPRHIAIEGTTATQITVADNSLNGGWRGLDAGTVTIGGGLTNTNIANNRFTGIAGAAVALGGAGVQLVGNYVNGTSTLSPASVCDPTCTTTPGRPCNNDGDCGTCSSTNKCVPEPVVWAGYPNLNTGSTHWAALNNILYLGSSTGGTSGAVGQCGTTPAGQLCAVASCAGGATCSGTPATCQTGADLGKRCCTAGTCTARQPWSIIRATDASHLETVIASNKIFGGQTASARAIDFAAGVSGNPDFSGLQISGNDIYLGGTASTLEGIVMPAGTPTITDAQIDGNHIWNVGSDGPVNWKGSYGRASHPSATLYVGSDQSVTSTSFVDVTGIAFPMKANAAYEVYCHTLYQTSAGTVAMGFALNGPASPALVEGKATSCSAGTCTSQAINNYMELHFSGYDTGVMQTSGPGATVVGGLIDATVINGSTAGNLVLRAKCETAGPCTVETGTFCKVEQMPMGN